MKYTFGFSLLELIIVMAIISILIGIAIPSYQIYTRRAHYTEVVEAAVPYQVGIEECFEITGHLIECTAGKNGIPKAITGEEKHSLIQSIKVNNGGTIIVTPANKYGITEKDTFILSPTVYKERLIWHHGGGGVAAGYTN